jgi:hypothetical protein
VLCRYCQSVIDNDRLEFLTEFNRPMVCKDCSTEQRAVGFMSWDHKTAPSLVMVPANAKETIRILDRANRRAR